jgi:hypothetical protein
MEDVEVGDCVVTETVAINILDFVVKNKKKIVHEIMELL